MGTLRRKCGAGDSWLSTSKQPWSDTVFLERSGLKEGSSGKGRRIYRQAKGKAKT
jgi:hypothetical protein